MGLLQRSLMARLLTYFLLLAIMPLGLIGYVAYESGRQNITDQVKAHLNSVATLKEQEIHNWIEHLQHTMTWMASSPHVIEDAAVLISSPADDSRHADAHQSLISEFQRTAAIGHLSPIFLLDRINGRIIASSDPAWEGKFRENEPYFIRGKGDNYISDIFHSLTMGQPTMVVSTPVRDTEGQLLGVLAGHACLEHLSSLMLERSGLGETGETFLVNKSNLLITNTVFAPGGAFKKWIFGEGAMWAMEGKSGIELFLDYRDEPVIGAYRWMEGRQLALIAKQDQAEAFAPINDLRNTILIVAGLLFFIAGGVGMLASRQITNPLYSLARYARRIGTGDYAAEVEIEGRDEVASVASDVRKMVGRLLQAQEELKATTVSRDELAQEVAQRKKAEEQLAKESLATADVLSDMLRGEVDNTQTEKRVLDVCLTATNSIYGMIGRINEHGKYDATTYSSKALQDCTFPEALTWKMSTGRTIRGIFGWPLLHRKSLICNDLQAHPDRVGFPEGHVLLDCFLGVPLESEGKTVGMVAVANKPGGYTEEDKNTLIRLASVISVSRQHRTALVAAKRSTAQLEKIVAERTKQLKDAKDGLEETVKERTKELVSAQEELLRAERLATLGQFSGSISHELRNPLGVVDSSVYYLRTKLKDADEKVQEHLDRIKSGVDSSTAIIESLLNLTRMKEPELSRLDLTAITSDAIAASKVPAKVKVTRDFPEQRVPVNGDGEQLRMAFKNIVKNAVEAMDGKGPLKITVGADADGQAEVSFADSGPGVAQEDLDKIFQPLFSTKAKGIGFGLSIAKMIIDKHGGTIEAESKPGKGATIVVKLPAYNKK